jgi:hypothetical protein
MLRPDGGAIFKSSRGPMPRDANQTRKVIRTARSEPPPIFRFTIADRLRLIPAEVAYHVCKRRSGSVLPQSVECPRASDLETSATTELFGELALAEPKRKLRKRSYKYWPKRTRPNVPSLKRRLPSRHARNNRWPSPHRSLANGAE